MKLLSPAKVNLFLNILFKRNDGYHEIETLFERISLTDAITLLPAKSGIKVLTNSKGIPTGPANLAYKAASLLKNKFHIHKGIIIKINKRIPVAAGLGGGSSNAATVLMGLNKLWKLRLPQKKLGELGALLGSDVPFFILNAPFALGRGRGEVLTKIQAPGTKIWHCLVKPDFRISTKKAYQSYNQSSLTPPLTNNRKISMSRAGLTPKTTNVKMLLHSIQKGHSSALAKLLINRLEHTLNKRVTEILKIKNELMCLGALGCLLSGSGPTVFGIYPSKQKAEQAAKILRKRKSWKIFVASTL